MRTKTGMAALAAALVLGAGCGSGSEAEPPLPVGRFHYRASHPIPDAADSIRLQGVLTVTFAASDSLAGQWEVERMHPELRAAPGGDGAVELRGQPTYFGTIVHRVVPNPQGGLLCSGRYSWVAQGGEERSLPVTCSLVRATGADSARS